MADDLVVLRKARLNLHASVEHIADEQLAVVVALEQQPHIKHHAFIRARVRHAGVQAARADEGDVARVQGVGHVVEGERELAGQNLQNLKFLMPVVGHLIAGMSLIDIMIIQRKIKRPALLGFVILQRSHWRLPPRVHASKKGDIVLLSAMIT